MNFDNQEPPVDPTLEAEKAARIAESYSYDQWLIMHRFTSRHMLAFVGTGFLLVLVGLIGMLVATYQNPVPAIISSCVAGVGSILMVVGYLSPRGHKTIRTMVMAMLSILLAAMFITIVIILAAWANGDL
jgi:hypothetical protein